MTNPKTAPFASVRLAECLLDCPRSILANADEDAPPRLPHGQAALRNPGVRRQQITADAGEIIVTEHHERDDEENGTDGHEELFTVMTGQAVFTIDGEELDAPAGTLSSCAIPHSSGELARRRTERRSLPSAGRPGAAYSSRRENDIDAGGG